VLPGVAINHGGQFPKEPVAVRVLGYQAFTPNICVVREPSK